MSSFFPSVFSSSLAQHLSVDQIDVSSLSFSHAREKRKTSSTEKRKRTREKNRRKGKKGVEEAKQTKETTQEERRKTDNEEESSQERSRTKRRRRRRPRRKKKRKKKKEMAMSPSSVAGSVGEVVSSSLASCSLVRTYSACLRSLFAHHGVKLGTERLLQVATKLGQPHENFDVLHVAGTNGKGTTCAKLAACLSMKGTQATIYLSIWPCLYVYSRVDV